MEKKFQNNRYDNEMCFQTTELIYSGIFSLSVFSNSIKILCGGGGKAETQSLKVNARRRARGCTLVFFFFLRFSKWIGEPASQTIIAPLSMVVS